MTSQVYTGYFKKGVELLLMVLETGTVLVRITCLNSKGHKNK